MPIIYYPDEYAKKLNHVVEQLQQPDTLNSSFGIHDLQTGALSFGIWFPKAWEVHRVSLGFATADAKSYSVSIVHGVGIVSGKNDRLWIQVEGIVPLQVLIPQGFYTGATLATAVAAALNAASFPAASKPFTTTYLNGLFTIAPAAGNLKLWETNVHVPVRRNSTAASSMGFTADSAFAASIASDTVVLGLGSSITCLGAAASTALSIVSTDVFGMTVDNQLAIASQLGVPGIVSQLMPYEVVYKVLDV